MRAHWISNLDIRDNYILTGDSLHHLVNVIRIERGEQLLLQNGRGLFVETSVEEISKRELRLSKLSSYHKDRPYHFDLALGMPKREALELTLKQATELGFGTIYLIKSDYSQIKFPEIERTAKLLVSALEQSNAPFLPEVVAGEWEKILWDSYEEVLLMDSQTKLVATPQGQSHGKKLLIVGPEGGFSPSELGYLHERPMVKILNLPTPILRTPTAVAVGAGVMLQSLRK
jgi:16S rRNA (uracil1498-N3)-methyltransferase